MEADIFLSLLLYYLFFPYGLVQTLSSTQSSIGTRKNESKLEKKGGTDETERALTFHLPPHT